MPGRRHPVPFAGGASDRPWIHLTATSAGTVLRGDPVASLGHRIVGADGSVDGVFAEWIWDGDRLVVTNDRFGAFPLFYWACAREIAVSRRLADLLALGAPAGLDHDALAVFLRLGFFLGEDTCFAAVRALPPNGRLTWTPHAVEVEARPPVPGQPVRTRREAVEGFIELFRTAIGRRLPDREYVLPLSGGRDSRHILLELARQRALPLLCVSGAKFPPDTGADVQIARRLADAVGVPHDSVGRPHSRLLAELAANAAQGMATVEGAWALPLIAFLRAARTRLTYDGIAGDALCQRSPPRLAQGLRFDADHPRTLAANLLSAGRADSYLPRLLGPGLTRMFSRDHAVERLAVELSRHADAVSPWTSFYVWNRTRRAMAVMPYLVCADIPTVHAPYLDRDLFDFLIRIPPGLAGGDLHDEVIHRAYPRYADVPFAPGVSRHGASFALHRLRYLIDLLTHVAVRRRQWWRGGEGMLLRLFRHAGSPDGLRTINRMMPLALYLLQVEELAAGAMPELAHVPRAR